MSGKTKLKSEKKAKPETGTVPAFKIIPFYLNCKFSRNN
jgi:hypothetical protein